MKTNVPIQLLDAQRNQLANLIDGKATKRLASRAEIVALCQQHIGGLVVQQTEVKDLARTIHKLLR
jgi:hypothetical protein